MSETFLDDFQVDVQCDQHRSVGVSEVVESARVADGGLDGWVPDAKTFVLAPIAGCVRLEDLIDSVGLVASVDTLEWVGMGRRLFVGLMTAGLTLAACAGEGDAGDSVTSTIPASTVATTTTTALSTTTTAPGLLPFSQDSMKPGQQEAYSFVSSSGVEIEYLLYVPGAYEDGRAWPLILSLHGFLGRGDQTVERVRTQNPLAWIDPNVEFPFVVVAPRGPDGLWSQYHEPVDELFGHLAEALSIDLDAQFLTGLSAGTIGTWQWALARPDQFAGIAPIAGGASMSREVLVPEDICRLVDLPIWVAHSEADEEAPIDSDVAIVAELEECGSTGVHFTVYENLGHGESISTAYAGPDLYEWMLEQVP